MNLDKITKLNLSEMTDFLLECCKCDYCINSFDREHCSICNRDCKKGIELYLSLEVEE